MNLLNFVACIMRSPNSRNNAAQRKKLLKVKQQMVVKEILIIIVHNHEFTQISLSKHPDSTNQFVCVQVRQLKVTPSQLVQYFRKQ